MGFDALTLNCFIAVADTGSFTKASQRINRTQSAVSQQIAKLETIIGRPLFVRGRNLSLTPDGELFYPYATQISTLYRKAPAIPAEGYLKIFLWMAEGRVKIPVSKGQLRFFVGSLLFFSPGYKCWSV